MKIIDQTPLFNEQGKITFIDEIKASLKYGSSWLPEIKAQKVIVEHLARAFDKGYTLLRNIPLAGSGVSIPLILVGPTGVYMLYVTHLTGMYRAKGDEWGMISGNAFHPVQPNLLTRAARLARALQVFLQKQGFGGLLNVEGVLMAADPGLHIDSVRPIVRVVMRDALERFAASVTQARVVLAPDAVRNIADHLVRPRSEGQPAPVQPLAPEAVPAPPPQPAEAAFTSPWQAEGLALEFGEQPQPDAGMPHESPFIGDAFASLGTPPESAPPPSRRAAPQFNRKQWIFLAAFGVVELIILIVFAYLVLSNL